MDLIFNQCFHYRLLIIWLLGIGFLLPALIDDTIQSNATIKAQSDEPLFIPTISASPYGQCSTQEWAYLDTIANQGLYSQADSSNAATMQSSMTLEPHQANLKTPAPLETKALLKTMVASEPSASSQPAAIQPIGLHEVAVDFYGKLKSERTLTRIDAKLPDDFQHLGFVGTLTFTNNVLKRLPKYRSLFEKIASQHDMDWRLLAAMAYQESLWNPKAVSPTGVRGLMMLTRTTAKELGINNRLDPEQSATGGAEYFNRIKRRLSKKITGNDRLCMTLASYNVGYGHLQDARILTQKLGGNPNKWADVKKRLPLLSQRKWYRKTKYGYARGHEPVRYVQNIQNYYNVLVWLTREETKTQLAKNDISDTASNTL